MNFSDTVAVPAPGMSSGDLTLLAQPTVFVVDLQAGQVERHLSDSATVLRFSDARGRVAEFVDSEGRRLQCREAPLAPLAIIKGSGASTKGEQLLDWLGD